MDIPTLSKLIKIQEDQILNAYPAGSHVYGTNNESSDEDYLIVSGIIEQRQDMFYNDRINVVIHSVGSWRKSLKEPSILSLECIFLPKEIKLKETLISTNFNNKPIDICKSALETSLRDWNKSKTKFESGLTEQGKKKIFHSLRILLFAEQIILDKTIKDYGAASKYWLDLYTDPSDDYGHYAETWEWIKESLILNLKNISK